MTQFISACQTLFNLNAIKQISTENKESSASCSIVLQRQDDDVHLLFADCAQRDKYFAFFTNGDAFRGGPVIALPARGVSIVQRKPAWWGLF
jgi:hypothetical protein